MSLLTSWLVALFVRWMRKRRGVTASDYSVCVPDESDDCEASGSGVMSHCAPVRNLPKWPLGASLGADMHDIRGSIRDPKNQPKMVSITLKRNRTTGKIYDCRGRELVSVEIRGGGRRYFRSNPAEILQALSSEVLTGFLITLLLVDNATFAESADSCRMGLYFIDATCVWVESVEGFGEAECDAELAVA